MYFSGQTHNPNTSPQPPTYEEANSDAKTSNDITTTTTVIEEITLFNSTDSNGFVSGFGFDWYYLTDKNGSNSVFVLDIESEESASG